MKKFISILLAAALLLSTAACGAPAASEATAPTTAETPAASEAATPAPAEPAPAEAPTEPEPLEIIMPPEMARYYLEVPATGSIAYSSDAITPLKAVKALPPMQAQDGVEPYAEYWSGKRSVTADLSDNPALAYSLSFSNTTTFSGMPEGHDPNALLLWGMDPGLNVDILHEYGFTGKGAVIAYVDQPIPQHEAYDNVNLHYTNNADTETSMHGPSVLSLLAGKAIGTAPEAEVYFYGHSAYYADQVTHAECLYQIIEQNKSLPEGKKITMVGFSDGIDPTEKNAQTFEEAAKACEEAGVMVWFCQEYGSASFLAMSDRNNPSNVVPDYWKRLAPSLVYVPAAGRTTANLDHTYTYWATAGLSWTMPYALGLYAIVNEIDPSLTQDDLRKLIVETAYDANGIKIVNPVGFVAKALQNVGRADEAQALLDAVAARSKYFYAVVNTAHMNSSDLSAIHSYLAAITDATVLVVDAAHFGSSEALYAALQADSAARGGKTVGIQIFGTPDIVPAFCVDYKVLIRDGEVDDAGTFLSDLFYGNFENDPARICAGYNVLDHFAENWDVDLVPQWPVARLPLRPGEFSAYFEKYTAFLEETGLQRQDLVNFSNPIFASTNHTDDMGIFLNRMKDEFGLLDIPYRLYGNKIGQYPVTTATLGGFTAEELAAENNTAITEFLINSHGQRNNIDKCYYENGVEKRQSLLNMSTINSVLSGNPYYLDLWTCNNGYGMEDNLTTTALNGSCVGVFSATGIISNNGVNCSASLPQMTLSNFYYFYYHYLAALNEGASRSRAFFIAQKEYAAALIAHSANGIQLDNFGNYQFNLCNLLCYHNFGVIEPVNVSVSSQNFQPNASFQALFGEGSYQPMLQLDDSIQYWGKNDYLQTGTVEVHNFAMVETDNGHTQLLLECTTSKPANLSFFNPPQSDVLNYQTTTRAGIREAFLFDVPDDVSLLQFKELSLSFGISPYTHNKNRAMVFFNPQYIPVATSVPENAVTLKTRNTAQVIGQIHSITIQELDKKTRIEVEFTAPEGSTVDIIAPSNAVMYTTIATGDPQTLTYEIPSGKLKQVKRLTLKAYFPYDSGNCFTEQVYPKKSN